MAKQNNNSTTAPHLPNSQNMKKNSDCCYCEQFARINQMPFTSTGASNHVKDAQTKECEGMKMNSSGKAGLRGNKKRKEKCTPSEWRDSKS